MFNTYFFPQFSLLWRGCHAEMSLFYKPTLFTQSTSTLAMLLLDTQFYNIYYKNAHVAPDLS